jgi:hypothetical protein
MTGVDVPPRVRVAALLTGLGAPAGLLLIAAGALELHWWGTPATARLRGLLTLLDDQYGVRPPALLRGRDGAAELIVIGALALAFGALAPLVARGRRAARTWVMVLAVGTFLVGLVGIGADLNTPIDVRGYLANLVQQSLPDQVTAVRALLYPGWYAWLEDVAQGLQVLVSLAVVIALAWATSGHPDHFTGGKRAAGAEPDDDWDEVISRLHRRTVGDPDQA